MNLSMHFFTRIILIWMLCLLSVLLHELGHALGYRISAGRAEWKVIAGSGPGIIGKSRYIFRLIPAGGYFIPEKEPETNKAKIITLAGGPLLSLLPAGLYGLGKNRGTRKPDRDGKNRGSYFSGQELLRRSGE